MRVTINVTDNDIEWLEKQAMECQGVGFSFNWSSQCRACDFLYRIYSAVALRSRTQLNPSADFAKLRED